jgi:Bacterial Ig-like domain
MHWFNNLGKWLSRSTRATRKQRHQQRRQRQLLLEAVEERCLLAVDAILAVDNVAPSLGLFASGVATNDNQIELRIKTPHPNSVVDVSLFENVASGGIVQIFEDVPTNNQGMAKVVTKVLQDSDYLVRARAGTMAQFFITCDDGLAQFETEASFTNKIDSQAPTATLASTATANRNAPIPVQLRFSEPVNDFALSDLIIQNGVLNANARLASATSVNTTQTEYSFFISPNAPGPVVVRLPAGIAYDAAQNRNAASNTLRIVGDSTSPTLQAIRRFNPTTANTSANQLTFRAQFSEPVNNASATDFRITGTTAGIATFTAISPTTYQITVSGGNLVNLNGTVGVDLRPTQNITDAFGNALVNREPTIDEVYTVTNNLPRVIGFTRSNPATPQTNADSLVFRARFTTDVRNVDRNDFVVTGSTASVTSVSTVSPREYLVRVSGGNLPNLNGTVGLDFSPVQNIADAFGNRLLGTEPATDELYTVDNTNPDTLAFRRTSAAQTNTNTLLFEARFGEPVVQVDAADFAVLGTSANITQVTAVSPTVYRILVSGGDLGGLNGNVDLNISNTVSISDLAGNRLLFQQPSIDEPYTVDNVRPSVLEFRAQQPTTSPTNADQLTWRVTFSEPVGDVAASDFRVTGTTATVTQVTSISNSVYDVTASGGNLAGLNGLVGLDLDGTPTIFDLAGGSLIVAEPAFDQLFTVDNGAPVLQSIARTIPSSSNTSANALSFDIAFNEVVQNFDASDLLVTGTTATVEFIVPGEGVNVRGYTVRISGGNLNALNGVVGLDLNPNHNITDAAGNRLLNQEPAVDEIYNVQNLAPRLLSFTHRVPINFTTNSDTLTFRAGFSQPVLNVDAADFVANGSTAIVTNVTPISPNLFDVTIAGGNLTNLATGTVGLNLRSNQNITNLDGIPVPTQEPSLDETYRIDNVRPTVTIAPRNVVSSPTNLARIPMVVTFSEVVFGVSGADLTLTNATVENFSGGGGTQFFFDLIGTSDGLISVDVNANGATDPALNGNLAASPFSVLFDKTPPVLQSIVRQTPAATITNANTLVFRATFNEPVARVNGADFVVTGSTASVSNVTAISTTVFDVTIAGGNLADLNGVVGLNLRATQNIADLASNNLPLVEPTIDQTYTLDNTAPVVESISTSGNNPTNQSPIPIQIRFSENVTGFTATDVVVANGTIQNFSGSNRDYTFEIVPLTSGTVSVSVPGNVASDIVGQTNTPSAPFSVVFDSVPPVLSSIVRQLPTNATTNSDTVIFRATFNEDVQLVFSNDFSVVGTTSPISNFVAISPRVYDVIVNGFDLATMNGTVGLNLSTSAVITDAVGNLLPIVEPAVDETYLIDNTAPTVTLSSQFGTITNQTPIPVSVTFSESVTDFDATDIQLSAGTLQNFSGSGQNYSFEIDVLFTGTIDIDILANVATDAAGNENLAAPRLSISFDNVAPVLNSFTRQIPTNAVTNANSLTFRATFNEDVTNVSVDDFSVSGTSATVTNVTQVTANTYDLRVSGGDLNAFEGVVGIDLAFGQDISDFFGNTMLSNEPGIDETFTLDNTRPQPTIFLNSANPTNQSPIPIQIDFGEDVLNFTAGDISISNGSVLTFTPQTSGIFLVEIDPGALLQGDIVVSIAANVADDLAGNTNLASNVLTIKFDRVAPTATLTYLPPSPGANTLGNVQIDFSEAVSGLANTDFSLLLDGMPVLLSGATISSSSGTGFLLNLSAIPKQAGTYILTLRVAGTEIADLAGNLLQSPVTINWVH